MRTLWLGTIISIGLAMAGDLGAQSASLGATAYPVLSVGEGARAEGMGESFTAVADDLSALHYNPAGLARMEGPQFSLTHNSYLDSGFFDALQASVPLGRAGTFAFGLDYLNYGSIDKRDAAGTLQGTYTPFDLGASGAFGFPLEKDLFFGLGSQWIRQEIDGVVHTGLLWDAGFLAEPQKNFSVGACLKNIGVDSGGYNLPAQLWAGTAYRFSLAEEGTHDLLLSFSGGLGFQGTRSLQFGLEYSLQKNYFFRAGYSRTLDQGMSDDLKGLDFGAGVKVGEFQLDYAFSFLGELGNVHRFSLSLFLPGAVKNNAVVQAQSSSAAAPHPASPSTQPDPSFLPPAGLPSKPVMLKFQVTSQEDQSAQQYFDQAEEKNRLGFKQEALELYLKAVDKDPHFQAAWMGLGKLYFDRSLDSYRKALEMDPKNDKLREWLGHFKP